MAHTNKPPGGSLGRGTVVSITAATLPDALRAACAEVGILDRDVPADGQWHKTDINGDPRGRGDGRIKLFADGEGGIVCNWKGETLPFFVDDGRKPTEAERRDRERRRADAIRLTREEEAREHAQAASRASAIWKAATRARGDHPYLAGKRVKAHGLRLYRGPLVVGGMPCDGSLIVPARDGSCAIHTLQFIYPEKRDGDNKRFLPGGDYRGRYFSIGTMEGTGPLCLCEGYATGASIHEATGYPVAVAFNTGNLLPVVQSLRARFPNSRLVLCADDDAATDGNPGLTTAKEAARAVNGWLAVPDFGENRHEGATDFNDLALHRGAEAVQRAIAGAKAPVDGEPRPGDGEAPGEAADLTGSATTTEFRSTDLGSAHRFARDHLGKVRYCWPWGRWLAWNGRYWSRDETGEIHRLAEATVRAMYAEAARSSPERREALGNWAVKSESHERRVKMLASAQAIEGMPIRPEDFDRDPWLLNVRNGTIDLRTGTLQPHAREDLITRGIDADYDPAAVCPAWERFVYQVFGGDVGLVAFVQRAIGYSLTGDIREHVFFIPHGGGSNGKSTLLDAIHDLLGAYAGRVPAELLMARRGEHHPTERATLYGKRFVSSSETGDGRRLAEDLVKSLTGGDPIACRRMREDFWEFRPTHKLWLATNHKPQIRGTDHAIWRRIHLIPFGVTFHEPETGKTPQKDTTLPERLREELAGILRWAVEGCLAWQREGLKASKAVRDATEGYRAEMDVLAAFFEERCVFDKRAEASAGELYRAYTRWCEATGEHTESQTSFGTRLRERGLTSHKGHACKVWRGIGLSAADSADSVDPFSGRSHEKNPQPGKPGNGSTPYAPSAACPSCASEGCDRPEGAQETSA